MCVEDYVKDFETLMIRCELQEPQEQTIARFLGGLNREIANIVELQPFVFLEDVIKLAVRVERQLNRDSKGLGVLQCVPGNVSNSTTTSSKSITNLSTKKEEKGDSSKQPAVRTKEKEVKADPKTPQRTRDIKCFKCLGHGHIASECPNKRVMIIKEKQGVIESEDEAELEEDEEVNIEFAEEGELLVIQRILNSQAKVIDEQRENIFHTRCKVGDKVCGMIIDGGSCTNVASTTLVEKLSLTTRKHPHPYKLQWLNDKEEIRVTQQVVVPFSIGKTYNDEVLCDVAPMNASHLLLGRPWQYDRRAVHDGFKNTYSFKKDGKNIVLPPLSAQQVHQDQLQMQQRKKEIYFARKGDPAPISERICLDGRKKAEMVKSLQESGNQRKKKQIAAFERMANNGRKCIQFAPGDLVWVHLRKERFPAKRKSKFIPREEGPF